MNRKPTATRCTLVVAGIAAIATLWISILVAPERGLAESDQSCEQRVVRDYERPMESMPPLTGAPISGKLPFAPRNTGFELKPGPFVFTLGASAPSAGFGLSVPSGNPDRLFELNWTITVQLSRVNRRGKIVRVVGSKGRTLRTISDRAFDGLDMSLPIPASVGIYKLQVTFSRLNGKRLGRYGQYIRVVAPSSSVRLVTRPASIDPGQSVRFWVENLGTEATSYDPAFTLERLMDGREWVDQPLSITAWPRIRFGLGAGEAGACQFYTLPSATIPGQYRITKSVGDRRITSSVFRVGV
jgi:hypothetical protein